MGAAVGRALVEAGHDVGWLPEGRGAGTRRRAEEAGLTALDDVADRDLVVSVCPPAAAVDTARSVAGFSGLYLDANAVSPGTASEVAAVVAGSYVDGGIVGPPPVPRGCSCPGRAPARSPRCSPAAGSSPSSWTARRPRPR